MVETDVSLSAHRIELARELLDDIELSRLAPEQLLLKAMRLARIGNDAQVRKWLYFELFGYINSEEGRKYMSMMGRWTEKPKDLGYWMPLAAINGTIAAMQTQIQQPQVPNVQVSLSSANPSEYVTSIGGSNAAGLSIPINAVLTRLNYLTNSITTLSGIRSRVLARVHLFVTKVYYGLVFSGAAESIFQNHQVAIDNLLRETAPDVLEKIPSISDRLAAGDKEAVSQAMNSCRRMIKAFADAVYRPSDSPVIIDGENYEVGEDNYLNRIKLFLRDKCASDSRRDRLNQSLRRINERASAGTHDDVTAGEARALFLNTYLTLGEILDSSKERPERDTAGS
jgi:hypothetical protein